MHRFCKLQFAIQMLSLIPIHYRCLRFVQALVSSMSSVTQWTSDRKLDSCNGWLFLTHLQQCLLQCDSNTFIFEHSICLLIMICLVLSCSKHCKQHNLITKSTSCKSTKIYHNFTRHYVTLLQLKFPVCIDLIALYNQ